jgi:hypothetical protein
MMEEELVVQQNENGESVVTLGGETVRTYKAGYSPSVMQDEIKRLQESLNKVQDYLATNATPPQNVVDALYKSTRSGVSRNIFTRLFGKLQENAINNLMAEEAKKYEKTYGVQTNAEYYADREGYGEITEAPSGGFQLNLIGKRPTFATRKAAQTYLNGFNQLVNKTSAQKYIDDTDRAAGRDILNPASNASKSKTGKPTDAEWRKITAGLGTPKNAAFALNSEMGEIDARNWKAILASDNPYKAAMDAKQAQLDSFDPMHFRDIARQYIGTNNFGDAAAGSQYLLQLDEKTSSYLKDKNSVSPKELMSAEVLTARNPDTGLIETSTYYKNPETTKPYIDRVTFLLESFPWKNPTGAPIDPSSFENLPNYPSEFQEVMGRPVTQQDFSDYGYTDPEGSFKGIMGEQTQPDTTSIDDQMQGAFQPMTGTGTYVPKFQQQPQNIIGAPQTVEYTNPYQQTTSDASTGVQTVQDTNPNQQSTPYTPQNRTLTPFTPDGQGQPLMPYGIGPNFNSGGFLDEGGSVDKESGNEVPIGSTKKEVRDDIPAMLSEGEFVLPADVVRYHGLEKIMQLRDEAKFGLKKMEAMGQMGNSDEATLDDDVPFGPADLIIVGAEPMNSKDETKEMAQGGVIRAQTGTFVPNTGIAGQTPPSSPATGYLPKFVTQAPNYSAPVVDDVTGITAGTGTTDTDTKFVEEVGDKYFPVKYINKETGEIREFYFYNGNPVTPIPDGFVPYDKTIDETVDDLESTSVETTQIRKGDDDPFKDMETPEMGVVNPIFGLFGQAATRLQQKQIIAAMEEKGIKPPETKSNVLTNIIDTISGLFNKDPKEVTTAVVKAVEEEEKGELTTRLDTKGMTPVSAVKPPMGDKTKELLSDLETERAIDRERAKIRTESILKTVSDDKDNIVTKRAEETGMTPVQTVVKAGSNNDDKPTFAGDDYDPRGPDQMGTPGTDSSTVASVNQAANQAAAQAEQEQQAAGNVESYEQTIQRGGGFNKGGLASRKKKKKK